MKRDAPEHLAKEDAGKSRHELRVLGGLHAGARTPLRESEGQVSIGRTTDKDIVLRDSPRSAAGGAIALNEDGWTWAPSDDADPIALPLGRAVRFGSAVITVDQPQAPWPDLDTLVIEPEAIEPAPPEGAEPASDDSTTPSESMTMATTDPAATETSTTHDDAPTPQAPGSTAKKHRTRARAWWHVPAWALLVLGGAAVIWISLSVLTTPGTQAAAAVRIAPSLSEDMVRAVVAGLGLSDSVKVLSMKDRGFQVVGVVDSDTQRDQLRERLSALEPAPLATVLTGQEFKIEVDALARTLEPGLRLAVQGRGKVLLSGIVGEHEEVDALSQRIAAELPAVIHVEKAVKTPPEIVAEFTRELSRLGLPMRARWEERQMLVDGKLPQDRIAQWEALLLRFNKQYGERMPFVASLDDDQPAGTTRAPAAATVLPPINAVVGGDAPYVVLADGRKINVGGSLNGYELVAIRNDKLVLRAGQGPLREVPR